MSVPQFSIIIPVFNSCEYLRQCLDSVTRQTYSNIEIILVDDGSTDKAPEICDEYAQQGRRVKVIHKANDGVAMARNDGLEKARGEYVIFVDNDDYIEQESCEHFHNLLLVYPETEIIACGFRSINPIKRKTIEEVLKGYQEGYISGYDLLRMHLTQGTRYIPPWVHIYRREFLIGNRLFFRKWQYIDDDSYWKPVTILSAKRCIISDVVYYTWNHRAGSLSHPISKEASANVNIERMQLCLDLEPVFSQISDEEFRARLFNTYILIYVNCIYDLQLYKKSKRHLICQHFLENKVHSKHTRNKVKRLKTFPYFFALVRRVEQLYKRLLTRCRLFANG